MDEPEDGQIEPLSEYDDPDEPESDRTIFDPSAWAAMQRLHARWCAAPTAPLPLLEHGFAQTGRYSFKIRLTDLADAIAALKLKQKPVPMRFELQPDRLRLSVVGEEGLVCQIDAPVTAGPTATGVCFERKQDLMIRLMRLRSIYQADAELSCEINLDKLMWTITLPPTFEEALTAVRKRGPKHRPRLRVGILVPEAPMVMPWERGDLGEGRAVDVEAIARALACAGRLMSHQVTPRQPSGIDVARGRALAGRMGAFYHVTDPSLEGLEFRVAPPDKARFLRVLARMNPASTRAVHSATAQIFTDGILICAVPRGEDPFPDMDRVLGELKFEDVVIRQNRERPFIANAGIFLPDSDSLITAKLHGLPGAFNVRFITTTGRRNLRGQIEIVPQHQPTEAPKSLRASSGANGLAARDEVATVDEPGPPEMAFREVTIASEAAYRVMVALPTGPVHLRFAASRVLAVVHELAGMRATACFLNRGTSPQQLPT